MPDSQQETCPPTPTSFAELDALGLNLQAVFPVAELPSDVRSALPEAEGGPFRQLLLIGHRGGALWQQLTHHGMVGEHPIDAFSQTQVAAWLARHHPTARCHFVYPGAPTVGLQRLGALAGWHHPSPFMVGVNETWGSWFAYRAVVLADTTLPPTQALVGGSPCDSCASHICVSNCPAGALNGPFNLKACLDHRRPPDSSCRDRCLARNSCPVGTEYRYSDEQISYHYGRSMGMIKKWTPSAA